MKKLKWIFRYYCECVMNMWYNFVKFSDVLDVKLWMGFEAVLKWECGWKWEKNKFNMKSNMDFGRSILFTCWITIIHGIFKKLLRLVGCYVKYVWYKISTKENIIMW